MALGVVGVPNVGGGDEELEGVVLVGIVEAALHLLLDLPHALLAVAAEAQLLLVAPQHRGTRLHGGLGQHVVKIDHLILTPIAHDDEHRAEFLLNSVLYEGPDARIDPLPHRGGRR